MPYLLPATPAVSDLGCVIVFYPDAEEYRRALLGQIMELADNWNWEGTRSQQEDATDSWDLAILETIACWP